MPKIIDIDYRAILTELQRKSLIPGDDIFDRPWDVFRARDHEFLRVDGPTFLHVMNFQVEQAYSLNISRNNVVCVQVMLSGNYYRSTDSRTDIVDASHIQITSFPRVTIDTNRGAKLRGVLIALEREYLVEQFGLQVDRIPILYRPIFSSSIGMSHVLKLPAPSSVRTACDQILSCRFPEPLRRRFLASQATEILCDVVHNLNTGGSRGTKTADVKSAAIEAAAAIYRREIHKPPTMEQLALRVGMNRNTLTEGFLEKFGATPHLYSIRQRLGQAEELLRTTELSVSEVARRIGYSGYASFARAYKSHFGRSIHGRDQDDSAILE